MHALSIYCALNIVKLYDSMQVGVLAIQVILFLVASYFLRRYNYIIFMQYNMTGYGEKYFRLVTRSVCFNWLSVCVHYVPFYGKRLYAVRLHRKDNDHRQCDIFFNVS